MRTTLKRGIGRGGANGNGQAGPPPLLTSVTRYQQPPRRPKRPLVGQILRGVGWFALVLLVVGAGIGGGIYLYGHETLNAINARDKGTKRAETKIYYVQPGHAAIALIAGYDHRAGTGTNVYAGSNSDTLMLVRADPNNNTLSLLSFPRDLAVNIYCKGNTVSTQNRINAAWAECGGDGGPLAAVDTMEHLTGLHINYLITLDFRAFKQVVNRLHGVYMNVDRQYYIAPHTGTSTINLKPGYQKLDGGQALSYVRFRHFDSDIYRNGRQQLFMEALKSRIRSELSLSNLLLLPQLIGALKGNLEVAKAGGGAVTTGELKSYLGLADNLPPGHLIRNAMPPDELHTYIVGGADELQASQADIGAAVQRFLHPVVPKTAAKKSGGSSTHTKKLARKDVSVLVLNAGNQAGEAANTTYLLKKNGFATKRLPKSIEANAPKLLHRTVVYYNAQQATGKQAAQELAPLFGSHTATVAMPPSIGVFARKAGNPLTVVSIGTSFSGKLTLPSSGSSNPSKTKVPPQVTDGLAVTLSAIRDQNGAAHFPLMVPHQVAAGSTISTGEGVRLFNPLRGKQELALSFNIYGGVEYYDIDESDWGTPPILSSPTYQMPYHHEKLLVYTSGGQIQMVALRRGKAVYWVTNTILNELSNSTMLAIAESLKPLSK